MKRTICYIGMAGCIMLFLQLNTNAQTHNGNLHRTVTQGADSRDRMPTSSHSHKESFMPENDKDFGIYAGRVTIFKQYFSKSLPRAAAKGFDDGIHLSSYNWKEWSEYDLQRLATSYNGVDMFVGLMYMKNSAATKDEYGNYTKEAIHSQNALNELKPNSCKTWQCFANMIIRTEDATMPKLLQLMRLKKLEIPSGMTGAVIDLDKFDNIAGDPMENPAFNEQAALRLLEKNEVKMDKEHSLKSPDPKAIALEAVQAIKGAVRSA